MIGDDDVRNTRRQIGLSLVRGTIVKSDDSKKLQEVEVRGLRKTRYTGVEHLLPYGFSSVPLPPKDGQEAEVFMAFLGADRSHPVVIGTVDRRHRPKDWQPGESGLHDDQGQAVKLGRNALEITGKDKLSFTVGNASATIENGKITLKVGDLVILHEADKIRLGGTAATKKVMLEDLTPAQKVYAL